MLDRLRVLVYRKSASDVFYNFINEFLMARGFVVYKTELPDIFENNIVIKPKKYDVALVLGSGTDQFLILRPANGIEIIELNEKTFDEDGLALRLSYLQNH